MMLIFRNNK